MQRLPFPGLFLLVAGFAGCSETAPSSGAGGSGGGANVAGSTSSDTVSSGSNGSGIGGGSGVGASGSGGGSNGSGASGTGGAAGVGGAAGGAGGTGTPPDAFAYVATYLGGVLAYAIEPTSGDLVEIEPPFDPQAGLFAMAANPSGTVLYAADFHEQNVKAYRVAPGMGTLTAVSGFPVDIGNAPVSIAIDPQGRFAYVGDFTFVSGATTSIHVFAIDPTNGTFSPVAQAPVPVASSADVIAPDPSGQFVYTSSFGIRGYSVDASGSLTELPDLQLASDTGWMAFNPGAPVVYDARSALNAYAIQTTGALQALAGSPFATGAGGDPGAIGLAVDAKGRFVCVVDGNAHKLAVYKIGPDAGLAAVGSPVDAGPFPYAVAIDPDGRFVYVTNDGSDILGFSIDQATFALTPLPHSPFSAPMPLQPEMIIVRASP